MKEQNKTLAQSSLWRLTRQFYSEAAEKAWMQSETAKIEQEAQPVPFYMTSNPLIASRWAEIVFHYYLYSQSQNSGAPFTICELGAGTARFAFLFIRHFLKLLDKLEKKNHPVKIILCDLSAAVIEHWRKNPLLKPYFDSGLLETSTVLIDEKFEKITTSSGRCISGQSPLEGYSVFMGGYLFDTLIHDGYWSDPDGCGALLFDVDDLDKETALGRLHHAKIEYKRSSEVKITDPQILSLCRRYGEAACAKGLDFTVPIGAIELCDRLKTFSTMGTLILSGDQGYSNMQQLFGEKSIEFGRHGTISLPVNYDAYSYLQSLRSASVYLSDSARHKFIECVSVHQAEPSEAFSRLEHSLERILNSFDVENYWQLVEQLHSIQEPSENSFSLDLTYLLLKLGKADPINFFFWMPSIFDKMPAATDQQRDQWEKLLQEVVDQFFVIEEKEVDLLLNAGALCAKVQMWDVATSFFEKGLLYQSKRADLHFNLGICYQQKSDQQRAALHFLQAEKIDPSFSLEERGLLKK